MSSSSTAHQHPSASNNALPSVDTASSSTQRHHIPVETAVERLLCILPSDPLFNSDITALENGIFNWSQYSHISVVDKSLQLYTFLRYVDLSLLPYDETATCQDILRKIMNEHAFSRNSAPSCTRHCLLVMRHNKAKQPNELSPLQMLYFMLEITTQLELRTICASTESDSTGASDRISTASVDTCAALGSWLRIVRINRQDVVPHIRSKLIPLSALNSKAVTGFYQTETASILKKARSEAHLVIDPSTLKNAYDFTDVHIAHAVIQVLLLHLYTFTTSNVVNLLNMVVLFLTDDDLFRKAYTDAGRPDDLAIIEFKLMTNAKLHSGVFDQLLISSSRFNGVIFDRLLSAYHIDVRHTVNPYEESTHTPSIGSFFWYPPTVYPSYTRAKSALITYGNYAVAAMLDKSASMETREHARYMFIPLMTARETIADLNLQPQKEKAYDVQWRNNMTGTLVQLSREQEVDHIRRSILMLYCNNHADGPQPNLLFALMSWFASTDASDVIVVETDSVQHDDLDRYKSHHPDVVASVHAMMGRGGGSHTHTDWTQVATWLRITGRLLRAAVRCLTREAACVGMVGGVFQDVSMETPLVFDTRVMTHMMEWVHRIKNAFVTAYSSHFSQVQDATERDKHQLPLLTILIDFFYTPLPESAAARAESVHSKSKIAPVTLKANVTKWFGDKRVLLHREALTGGAAVDTKTKSDDVFEKIRMVLWLALGGGASDDEYKLVVKHTGAHTPFIVFVHGTPMLMGKNVMLRDTHSCLKSQDASQLVSSIVNKQTVKMCDTQRTELLRVFTNAAKYNYVTCQSAPNKQTILPSQQKASIEKEPVSTTAPASSSQRPTDDCEVDWIQTETEPTHEEEDEHEQDTPPLAAASTAASHRDGMIDIDLAALDKICTTVSNAVTSSTTNNHDKSPDYYCVGEEDDNKGYDPGKPAISETEKQRLRQYAMVEFSHSYNTTHTRQRSPSPRARHAYNNTNQRHNNPRAHPYKTHRDSRVYNNAHDHNNNNRRYRGGGGGGGGGDRYRSNSSGTGRRY
jgi:hypothetical protein